MSELTAAEVVQTELGPLADRRAIAAYRRRLVDLADELAEAEDRNDLARAERLQLEREALLGELGAVTGLGNRQRRTGSSAERMRKAVTSRIRQAITRVSAVHPELGRHLDVRTGTYSSYQPEYPVSWELHLARARSSGQDQLP